MVFSSAIFLLVFLPITFVANFLCPKKFSNLILLIASLIFYAWGEPYLVLLMMISILINWGVGKIISKSDGLKKKTVFILGVVCDLSILGYYKYAGFFVDVINGVCRRNIMVRPDIALPIGISFFTFQAISYIADVYRGDTEASPKLVNVAMYISFFPQLIAGPIVKYKDINKQIESRSITYDGVALGFKRFIYGLSKKVIIANVLGECLDSMSSYGLSVIGYRTAWIAALAYTMQIYYDFSGYSDMAIGLGRMFGFNILENFNYPYLSKSITEFWRRWHISLGTWFREYVYFPLGGNKKGKTRTYINLFVVFFLTGLWHGADFSFIVWGLYHGFFTIIERLGLSRFLERHKVLSTVYCFLVVNFGWVIFRTADLNIALKYLARMILPWRYYAFEVEIWKYADRKTLVIMICAILGMGGIKKLMPKRLADKWDGSVLEAVYCVVCLILSLAAIVGGTYNPFIYFQF